MGERHVYVILTRYIWTKDISNLSYYCDVNLDRDSNGSSSVSSVIVNWILNEFKSRKKKQRTVQKKKPERNVRKEQK